MTLSKSLYYLSTEAGIPVYNARNVLIGTTTPYRAIAHNGKCIGSIQIDTGTEDAWISGYGVAAGEGIKWTAFGTEGRKYFMFSRQFCTNAGG